MLIISIYYTIPMQQVENDNEIQIPTLFSHSVKIEQNARGARVSVHVYANSGLEAMQQAINLYRATKLELEQLKEVVAPIEVKA